MTNCPNCGAVREPAESRCPYCGTPYPKDTKVAEAVAVPISDIEAAEGFDRLLQEIATATMTPNEARRRMGLPPR